MQQYLNRTICILVLLIIVLAVPVAADMATPSGSSGVSRGDYQTLTIYEAKETFKRSEGGQYVTPWTGIAAGSDKGCSGSRSLHYRYRLLAPDGTDYNQVVYQNTYDAGGGLRLSSNGHFFRDTKAVQWFKVSDLINDASRKGFSWVGTWTMEFYFGDNDCPTNRYNRYERVASVPFTLVDDTVPATTTARPATTAPTTMIRTVATTASVSPGSFGGEWSTSFGSMYLVQTGSEVMGTYEYTSTPSAISGTVSGTTLAGTWTEPGKSGEFMFVLSPDGTSFSGNWKNSGDRDWAGTWTGTKKTATTPAQPTRTVVTPQPTATVSPPTAGSIGSCTGSGTIVFAEDRTMQRGSVVRIPVMVCNVRDLANMDLTVTYDTAVLQFRSAERGGLNSNALFESNEGRAGMVKISFAGTSGTSGSGSVAILTFAVTGTDGAASPIRIQVDTASTAAGSAIPVTVCRSCSGKGLRSGRAHSRQEPRPPPRSTEARSQPAMPLRHSRCRSGKSRLKCDTMSPATDP
jgi:hypothetical protein